MHWTCSSIGGDEPGRTPALGRHDPPGAEPAREEVEEVDAVLDEDAAAFRPVPEPVVRARGSRRMRNSRRMPWSSSPRTLRSIRRPTASLIGLYRCIRLATSSRSRAGATAIISSAWATVIASGFSQITCLPARRASIACGWCRNGGVAM